jgi:hypothetical protein
MQRKSKKNEWVNHFVNLQHTAVRFQLKFTQAASEQEQHNKTVTSSSSISDLHTCSTNITIKFR